MDRPDVAIACLLCLLVFLVGVTVERDRFENKLVDDPAGIAAIRSWLGEQRQLTSMRSNHECRVAI